MVTAMAKPDGEKGGRGKLSQNRESFSKTELNAIAQARYVLRNNFTPEGQQYPDRCFAVMAGTLALTEAYAMTQVDTLRKMAERIQARAIRRCGELLKQVETGQGVRTDLLHDAADMKLTRTEAATQAGLSERQKVTALRVANVPTREFDALVESEKPPTVTKLAEQGKTAKPFPLHTLD